MAKSIPGSVRLVTGLQAVFLAASSGQGTIEGATDVFLGDVDPKFKAQRVFRPPVPTNRSRLSVLELVTDGTLRQIFSNLDPGLTKICLTEDQIIRVCRARSDCLRLHQKMTFFPFLDGDGKFTVAAVTVMENGLLAVQKYDASRGPDSDDDLMYATAKHRVIVPTPVLVH